MLTAFNPNVGGTPKLLEAVQHSRVVRSYGSGPEQVNVYKVQR